MKMLFPVAALLLSSASLSAGAAVKASALLGEPAAAPSSERAIVAAVANRTITIGDKTKWVNVKHFEVIRFVSNGREFTWYFDGTPQSRSFDLAEFAPAGVAGHSVTVYVSPSEADL